MADATMSAMAFDIRRLRDAAAQKKWTDDTPVPPKFFGRLWPHGEPEGWPVCEMPTSD